MPQGASGDLALDITSAKRQRCDGGLRRELASGAAHEATAYLAQAPTGATPDSDIEHNASASSTGIHGAHQPGLHNCAAVSSWHPERRAKPHLT
jgi:hypothetical protein